MKNQYVGDINDYRKYGLIDLIARAFGGKTLFVWMLTPYVENREGNLTEYLSHPDKYRGFNEILFDDLKKIVSRKMKFVGLDTGIENIETVENSALFNGDGFDFINEFVPDDLEGRSEYFKNVYARAEKHDVIFLDPDNGLEVKSTKCGNKDSSKYVYWEEIKNLFDMGKNLLIYQHFPRQRHKTFIEATANLCRENLPGVKVIPIETQYVLFLLATNSKRSDDDIKRLKESLTKWKGELDFVPLSKPN